MQAYQGCYTSLALIFRPPAALAFSKIRLLSQQSENALILFFRSIRDHNAIGLGVRVAHKPVPLTPGKLPDRCVCH